MKNRTVWSPVLALSLAGFTATQAATFTLVDNTNASEVTGGGTGFVSQILIGQTLYIGIPHAGAGWSLDDADSFEVSTFLLGDAGATTASFNFYSATDTGAGLSSITPLPNFTAGVTNVASTVSSDPADPGNTSAAGVSVMLDYAGVPDDPFGPVTGDLIWLGITNTGDTDMIYYTGTPFGGGTPAPTYEFAHPFDDSQTSLYEDTYTYDSGGTLGASNQNVHPYVHITVETVPEPAPALLGGLGLLMLLRRQRTVR